MISLVDLATGDELRSIEVAGTLRDFDIDPSGSQVIASVQTPDATVPPKRNDTELDTRGRLTVLRQWGVRSGKLLDELKNFDLPIAQVRYGAARWNCFIDMEYPAGIDDDLDHPWRWIRLPSGERLDAESCFSRTIASDLHRQLFFSADEKRFLIQGGDVCVHELPSGKPSWCAEPREYPSEKAAFSPDGRFGWFDRTLTEMANGHQRKWYDLWDVSFFTDGQRIFHQGSNGVGILSLATGEFLWHRRLNWNSQVHDAAVSADGRYVVLLLSDSRVFANDQPATRLVLLDRKDENNPRWTPCDAQQICFGPNEQTLIVAGEKSVRQIDFASLDVLLEHAIPALPMEQQTDARQVSPRADWPSVWPLVWIDERPRQDPLEGTSELSFWLRSAERQVQNERSVETDPSESDFLNLYEMGPRSADWTRQLVFNSRERSHSLVDEDWRVLHSFPKTDGDYQATLSPSGQRVAVCPRESSRRPFTKDLSIELWDADSGRKLWSNPTVAGTYVSGLEMDRDDRYVMINDNGGRIIMLDASDGKQLACYPVDGRQLLTVSSFAANGRTVAEAKRFRSRVTLRAPSTLEPIETIDTIFPVSWLRWTPDSKHLVVGQSFGDGMELVMCWDVATREEDWTVRMPEAREIEFDQAGDWMLARCGGYQGVTTLCRVEDGTISAAFLPTYTDGQRRLVLSKAGGTVYQGSENGGVVWPSP